MKLTTKTVAASLPPALKAFKPNKADVDKVSSAMVDYFDRIDSKETEENLKTHLMDVFKKIYAPAHVVEQQGVVDFVIRSGGKDSNPAVLVEAKRASNKADMIRAEDINRKALHELVLYYMRQRSSGNTDIQHLVICTEHELYIFKAAEFERQFYRNAEFRKQYAAWNSGQKSDASTDFFYRDIAHPFIAQNSAEMTAVYANLQNVKATLQNGAIDKAFVDFVKILSPNYLLNQALRNDSNSLNKAFYDELLHLIGLEETKKGSKRIIGRLKEGKRNAGSLVENTINQIRHENEFNSSAIISEYGNQVEERAFNIALELCLSWINRLLFLKLLEAQIYRFHEKDESYKFLSHSMIAGFGPLSELFFQVLASKPADRSPHIETKYIKVPYLNSSLFEQTALEASFKVSSLASDLEVPLFSATILRDASGRIQRGSKNALKYIFEFLDAYDFGSDGQNQVKLESKTIINASVLGLIFEKINGYRDGAIFTPGYITMYMARSSIEQMVLEAFRRNYPDWKINAIGDLRNYLADNRSKPAILSYNSIIDDLKICDPAVGSGHFLVSCLNELIALKSRLGILADRTGERLSDFSIDVDNDELNVRDTSTNEIFAYQIKNGAVPKAIQDAQKTLFHEKQKLIENCLFGVDININSVHICQLRLWIELLKSAYYKDGIEGELETLPNIDINIKCGNSLLSRFELKGNFSNAFSRAKLTVAEYRQLVNDYKTTKDKAVKRDLQEKIATAKKRFQEEELERQNKLINSSIAVLRGLEAQEEMFDQDAAHEASRAKKLADIRARILNLEMKRDAEMQNKTFTGALEWRFEFPEALDQKGDFVGFDLVIVNPPYGVSMREPLRSIVTKNLGKVPDYEIYYLFINLAAAILKKEGRTCQIIPNTILFNVNAGQYRESLLKEWKDIHVDDITHYPVFDGVVVHNIILHAKRRVGRDGVSYRATGHDSNVIQFLQRDVELADSEMLEKFHRNWGLIFKLSPEAKRLVSKIRSIGKSLKDNFSLISQGLIAYDKYQGTTEEAKESRAFHSTQKTASNSPWLKGEDVTRYCIKWNGGSYIEYGSGLANPRKPEYFSKPRILVREITNPRIYAGYTEKTLYNDPAVINILADTDGNISAYALLAILNSKLASFYHFNSSPKATKGAFPKILVDDIHNFPLPESSGKTAIIADLAKRAAKMIKLAQAGNFGDEFAVLDEQNERDVREIYGLSIDEGKLVDTYFDTLFAGASQNEVALTEKISD